MYLQRSPLVALLEVDKLSVRFGGVNAVADVSLSIATGEIHGIIGPNGAGKTSLINAATGMVPVQSGSIRFAGRDIVGRAPHTISGYGLGRTFQHVELFGDRTVFENVLTGFYRHQSYGLLTAALRVGKSTQVEKRTREQARTLLGAFDLARFADARAGHLPFGIQKRVDIARALAAEPRLLFLDEPVSGMSEAEAESAVTTMRALAREHGITLVIVEHNMHVLMNLAERVTVLNQGRILASDIPDRIQADSAVIEAYLGQTA
jgi:branched-chain amino acid transport system ATP-binding protein